MRSQRTQQWTCRHKQAYSTEVRALAAIRGIYLQNPERNGENRAYPCNQGDTDHWHLTSQPILANAQAMHQIQILERTIRFLLVELEKERRDRDLAAGLEALTAKYTGPSRDTPGAAPK